MCPLQLYWVIPKTLQLELKDPAFFELELEDSVFFELELEDPAFWELELEDPVFLELELEEPVFWELELELREELVWLDERIDDCDLSSCFEEELGELECDDCNFALPLCEVVVTTFPVRLEDDEATDCPTWLVLVFEPLCELVPGADDPLDDLDCELLDPVLDPDCVWLLNNDWACRATDPLADTFCPDNTIFEEPTFPSEDDAWDPLDDEGVPELEPEWDTAPAYDEYVPPEEWTTDVLQLTSSSNDEKM